MLERTEDLQCLHHDYDAGFLREPPAIDLRQPRSKQAPDLCTASTPAAQGHSAAAAPVATAAAFPSVCNRVRSPAWSLVTIAGLHQDQSPGDDDARIANIDTARRKPIELERVR